MAVNPDIMTKDALKEYIETERDKNEAIKIEIYNRIMRKIRNCRERLRRHEQVGHCPGKYAPIHDCKTGRFISKGGTE